MEQVRMIIDLLFYSRSGADGLSQKSNFDFTPIEVFSGEFSLSFAGQDYYEPEF
jgi:hypothetical protein